MWNVAIEYQGLQHDHPVEFFGGEDAFIDAQLRDERKRDACEAASVTLIEIRPAYDKDALLEQIAEHRWPKVDSLNRAGKAGE